MSPKTMAPMRPLPVGSAESHCAAAFSTLIV
jgi:hypothetical protein